MFSSPPLQQQRLDTPPMSRNSSPGPLKRKSPALSIDLSDLPPLITPSDPSNTLLLTNLQDPSIFSAPFLAHLQNLIATHSPAGIYAFSPLRTLRRIVITFPDIESAVSVRSMLDGEALCGDRVRVYFGENTPLRPLSDKERHLQAPKLDKQFFISPPPSPPAGWEVRHEDPPNKDVHASDLATALQRLSAQAHPDGREVEMEDVSSASPTNVEAREPVRTRSGSSTIVYQPQDHGHSPDLPAIAVEDTTDRLDELDPEEGGGRINVHTARPPVELNMS